MPDYRIDPNDYLRNQGRGLTAQQRQGGLKDARRMGKIAAQSNNQPSFNFPSLQQIIQGATGGKRGLQSPRQAGATARQLNPLAAAQGTVTAANLAANAVTPNLAQQGPLVQFGQGFLSGPGAQTPTDSNVNAGPGAGVPTPQTQQTPINTTLPTGRDAYAPSLAQAALVQNGLEQTQFAGGTRQVTPDNRTLYNVPGGRAEFQGAPRGGTFSGIATNAEAAQRLADYQARGLNAFGNDLSIANSLNAQADQLRQSRLANRVGNHQFRPGQQAAALAELQETQRLGNEQIGLAQQQNQADVQNALALRGLQRQEADTQSQIAARERAAAEASAFSEKSLSGVAAEAAKTGLPPAEALFQYATSLGGLYNPKTGVIFTPSELQADAAEAGVPFEQYYQQLLANYQSLLKG